MELIEIKNEVTAKLADQQTSQALLATTFKELNEQLMRRAIMEGMIRGFQFKDFLEKNVYALPFKDHKTGIEMYSLVTSIDYARKIGMRSGVCGKSAPTFVEKDDKIISCSITIKRKVDDYIGDYSATVYMSEYSTGRQLWGSKPRTMLAKVAEMHALRMACPEEMSAAYIEEEKELEITPAESEIISAETCEAKLRAATTLDDLRTAWARIPKDYQEALIPVRDELKAKFTQTV